MPAPLAVPALAAASLLLAALVAPASATPDPLARYRWHARVLLVAAPDDHDARLLAQRQVFRAMGPGAAERDLVLVEAIGGSAEAEALRSRFALRPDTFTAVLIGKDGGAKLRSDQALGADGLFPVIDAMPMRRDEMGRHEP